MDNRRPFRFRTLLVRKMLLHQSCDGYAPTPNTDVFPPKYLNYLAQYKAEIDGNYRPIDQVHTMTPYMRGEPYFSVARRQSPVQWGVAEVAAADAARKARAA